VLFGQPDNGKLPFIAPTLFHLNSNLFTRFDMQNICQFLGQYYPLSLNSNRLQISIDNATQIGVPRNTLDTGVIMAMSVLQANRDGSEGLSMLHTWQAVKLINSCFRGRIVKGNGNILALSNAVLRLNNVIKSVTPKKSHDKDSAGTGDSYNG